MVQPTSLGGYGRQKGTSGGLEGVEFAARCPPDVQKNTRIVAVCAVSDFADAAPQQDGWFFSDFFLFYQMLGSRSACKFNVSSLLFLLSFPLIDPNTSVAELPNQLWLASCSPADLIRKYERYLHGPSSGQAGDQRVVMNLEMLPKDEMSAGFRLIKPKDLLERFLATLKSEVKEAAQTKQPVLVLIFGHGEVKTYGIQFGSSEGSKSTLNQARLASVLQRGVQTTMVITSCYSGGWFMAPNANEHFDVKPMFNHSFLTAAKHDTQSISWSVSQSMGRQSGGSVFATCLLNSLITASDKTEDYHSEEKVHPKELNDKGHLSGEMEGKLYQVEQDDEGEDLDISMAALTRKIFFECQARCGSIWDDHGFSFAAQDDLWAKAWGKRTGLPLLNYKEKWESLPEAPSEKRVYPPTGPHIGSMVNPITGSIMSKSHEALHNIVKVKAIRYMNSHPFADNVGSNTNCHPYFHRLIEGAHFEFDRLYKINDILDYRLGQNALAEIYCNAMEIGVPEGLRLDQFDASEWKGRQHEAKKGRSPEQSKTAQDLLKRFDTVREWDRRSGLFDRPCPWQGLDYLKPVWYLAARLAESPMSSQEIHEKLEALLQGTYALLNTYSDIFNSCVEKLRDALCVARSPLGVAVLNQPEIKNMRVRLYGTVGRLKHRLRSLSPQKGSPRREYTD